MSFGLGVPQPHSSISLIPLWLSNLKAPSCVPGAAWGLGRERPPPKWGVMRSRTAIRCNISLFDRLTGRSRPHLSLRED